MGDAEIDPVEEPAPSRPRTQDAGLAALGLLDAHDQAALVRSGAVTGAELIAAAIARIEAIDPVLNAVSHRAFDLAEQRVRDGRGTAEMAGVPYLLKDSLAYVGMPSRCGSYFRANAPSDTRQHPFADRLDEAGLIPLGKTTVPEFSLLPTTESALSGETRNPWDIARSAGGSSGGAAVAVASGMTPLAHAADGGGSIRIPASCCGVVGLKPSRGANLRAREFHLVEDVLVGDGMLARSVRDVAWAARLVRPPTPAQRPKEGRLRIALCLSDLTGAPPHPDVAEAIERSARLCEQLGHRVEYVERLPPIVETAAPAFRALWEFLTLDLVGGCERATEGRDLNGLLEPWALGMAASTRGQDGNHLAATYAALGEIRTGAESLFRAYDILLSPVVRDPPPRLGHLAGSREYSALAEDMFAYIGYTPLQNIAGQPSISLPLFLTPGGLPIGSMFSAAWGEDETLLTLAAELEQAAPWRARRPAVHAMG